MTRWSEDSVSGETATPDVTSRGGRPPTALLALSALFLLAMGGIHLFLVTQGTGGLLGVLFVLNALGALALAIAILVSRRRVLPMACLLSLLFMAGTLLALLLALTVGLFGIREHIGGQLVVTTIVVESIGIIVLAITTALAFRMRRK
jgi:hypothetical protein